MSTAIYHSKLDHQTGGIDETNYTLADNNEQLNFFCII